MSAEIRKTKYIDVEEIIELINYSNTKLSEKECCYEIDFKALSHKNLQKRKENVFSKLITEHICYLFYPDQIEKLFKPAKKWREISKNIWLLPPDINIEDFYDALLYLGGWILFLGGTPLSKEAIMEVDVFKTNGIKKMYNISQARMIIVSFFDDISWRIMCKERGS